MYRIRTHYLTDYDELLLMIAERLKAVAGTSFTVSRLGGDEFAIILPRIESLQ